ncbi:MAG: 50S ribosomal protein P1 [Thaumarchaeota archaeon]|nr:50S ribosomal protein P1 [Nitrososphaerota archaeon]RNJ71776.1 MAG: 50S ribosomal protein P1 [Thaumarchaeota archaeon S13]RNJ72498.1 MAG: 50S ribosomal protein P1 [Thaumarchaeota archaeon S14]RNJ76786.1 MAG: 50S ribosomal protein P1 [Thaumarchaeota archaeon S15]MDD9808263.1 50S ribosomal protein P1 [Nitrososphaerota archaeon]
MEYVYAALLLHKLKKEVNEESVSSVIKASGAEVNAAQVKSLVAALADVNIDEAVKAAPVAVAAAPAAEAPAAEKGGEAKAEEKKDAKSEEQAIEGLSSLFD